MGEKLIAWAGDDAPTEGEQAQRSLDLYHLLVDTYEDSGEIEKLVNAGKPPEGKVGEQARELAHGLARGWAQQLAAALIEDEVVSEDNFDSEEAMKAIVAWVELIGG